MFPRLRQTISTTLVDRIDDLVEFTTLGEYVLADDLRPIATGPGERACEGARSRAEARPTAPQSKRARSRDVCPAPDWAWPTAA